MNKSDIRASVFRAFSAEDMLEALTEQISQLIDYEELAIDIVSEHEDEIMEEIQCLALETLTDGMPF